MPTRNPPASSVSRVTGGAYDTRAEEYLLADRVSNVNYLSNTLMDEGYDTALKSRGRDQQLLREATNAIPRGSLRDTTSLMSSPSSFGSRRFPRRFGKARLRKNQGSSYYSSRLPDEEKSATTSTSDLMASVGPSPLGSWRRYGRARSSSAARSYLEDDDFSPDRSAYSSRASSIGPSPSSNTTLSSKLSFSPSCTRRSLPPYPVTKVSEGQVLERDKPWGQSVSPSRLGSLSSSTRPEYVYLTREYDPDITPTTFTPPRRRQKVLASSRRPAGNYYERLLKKRGKRQGRFGPYYDVESIEGSDLSGVLSDVDSLDEYTGASLLLSVEGAGMSPEGKRVDFTYTPPPIPLYGRTMGLDDKLLGIKPSSSIKPLDDFISGYMERMGALKAALTDRLDKDREKRTQYGLKPLDTGPRPSSTRSYTPSYTSSYTPSYTPSYTRRSYSRSYTPSYTQSYDYVPVKHLSSQKLEHMPVTTFRRRQDDGQTQRLDVFSLGEFRPRLSSSTERAITIPESATGGHQLSVLDKINIKAAIIASKMEPDPIKRRRPRSEYAANKYRELRKEASEGGPQSQGSGQHGSSSLVALAKTRTQKLARQLERVSENLDALKGKPGMKKKSRFLGKGTSVTRFPSSYDLPETRLITRKKTVRFELPDFEDTSARRRERKVREEETTETVSDE